MCLLSWEQVKPISSWCFRIILCVRCLFASAFPLFAIVREKLPSFYSCYCRSQAWIFRLCAKFPGKELMKNARSQKWCKELGSTQHIETRTHWIKNGSGVFHMIKWRHVIFSFSHVTCCPHSGTPVYLSHIPTLSTSIFLFVNFNHQTGKLRKRDAKNYHFTLLLV